MFLYFKIQFKILNRRFSDFGLPPIVAYILFPILFVTLSHFLFEKTQYAVYLYYIMVISFVIKLSDRKRNDFLKLCYNRNHYYTLRFLENLVIAFPFIGFLIYKLAFMAAIITLLIVLTMAYINFNTAFNYSIPSPFFKTPFEFTIGFRKTFFMFPLAYGLTTISVFVDNFNLGIASILLIFMVCMSYYSKLENEYLIWSFNLSPTAFLKTKVKTALYYASILALPIAVILCFNFYNHFVLVLLFLTLGYVFLITILLAKYALYPNAIHLPQAILIAFCIFFPPLLIVVLPYFYKQSVKRLQFILE